MIDSCAHSTVSSKTWSHLLNARYWKDKKNACSTRRESQTNKSWIVIGSLSCFDTATASLYTGFRCDAVVFRRWKEKIWFPLRQPFEDSPITHRRSSVPRMKVRIPKFFLLMLKKLRKPFPIVNLIQFMSLRKHFQFIIRIILKKLLFLRIVFLS